MRCIVCGGPAGACADEFLSGLMLVQPPRRQKGSGMLRIATEPIVAYDANGDGVVLVARGDEIPDHVAAMLDGPSGDASPVAAATPNASPATATVSAREELEAKTVKELGVLADEEGVDLGGARRKDDIIDAILAARGVEEPSVKKSDDVHNKARTSAANKGVKGPVDADTTPETSDASSVATGDDKE